MWKGVGNKKCSVYFLVFLRLLLYVYVSLKYNLYLVQHLVEIDLAVWTREIGLAIDTHLCRHFWSSLFGLIGPQSEYYFHKNCKPNFRTFNRPITFPLSLYEKVCSKWRQPPHNFNSWTQQRSVENQVKETTYDQEVNHPQLLLHSNDMSNWRGGGRVVDYKSVLQMAQPLHYPATLITPHKLAVVLYDTIPHWCSISMVGVSGILLL